MRREHIGAMKTRRRNICLTVAYDGTAYHGFQRQTPPILGVQNVLEDRLSPLFGDTIEMAAAGRTDAGVHALGQVVNFFTDGTIPVERIPRAAEGVLPDDVAVLHAREADRDFSARHSVKRKTYVYRIQLGERPDPFTRNYAWHVRRNLDISHMKKAMEHILGTIDFSSFRASGGAPMSPVRTMYSAEIREFPEMNRLELEFCGNGFLYHMVRNIVGTLVHVGLGEISPEGFGAIVAARDRKKASPTAPAMGLYLKSVEY